MGFSTHPNSSVLLTSLNEAIISGTRFAGIFIGEGKMAEYDPKVSPWKLSEKDFPSTSGMIEQMKFLLGYAVLAPSSHNTQPWKFALRDGGVIDVFTDLNGWLRVADPDQRELNLSIGCAIENLLIAARHFGFDPKVKYLPDANDSDYIASIELKKSGFDLSDDNSRQFKAITERHTNHKNFERRSIEPGVLQFLENNCSEPGISLYLTINAEFRQKFDDLIVRSDAVTYSNPEYREELAYWIGKGVFGTSWLISQIGRLAMAYLNFGDMVMRGDEAALMSAPVIGIISTTINNRINQIRAGQVFERVYLSATSLGIGVRPMSQVCQVAEHKQELAGLLPAKGNTPLQPFLLGFAEPAKEHTPRKSVDEVMHSMIYL